MLRRTLLAALAAGSAALPQAPPPSHFPPANPDPNPDVRLPNGKSQRDEIVKSEHEKSLHDASELVRLAEELKVDLEKAGSFVVSVQTIRKTDDIEKIAKRIRGRLKRG